MNDRQEGFTFLLEVVEGVLNDCFELFVWVALCPQKRGQRGFVCRAGRSGCAVAPVPDGSGQLFVDFFELRVSHVLFEFDRRSGHFQGTFDGGLFGEELMLEF
ncbi:Uncharacterised protein [Bordetella trematum]|nr:Uncharacterised protein [Bordetella trematum]